MLVARVLLFLLELQDLDLKLRNLVRLLLVLDLKLIDLRSELRSEHVGGRSLLFELLDLGFGRSKGLALSSLESITLRLDSLVIGLRFEQSGMLNSGSSRCRRRRVV